MRNWIAFIFTASLCYGIFEPVESCLIECTGENNNTWTLTIEKVPKLYEAVKSGNVAMINKLLKAGENMYVTDGRGLTPLHFAITSKNNYTKEMILAFLNNEFDIYKDFGEHDLILFYAVIKGSYESIETLLKFGCPPDIENKDLQKPLQLAIKHNRIDVAGLLMYFGAASYKYGENYILKAIESGKMEEIETIIATNLILGYDYYQLIIYLERAIEFDRPSMVNLIMKYAKNIGYDEEWKPLVEMAKKRNKKAALNALIKSLIGYGYLNGTVTKS